MSDTYANPSQAVGPACMPPRAAATPAVVAVRGAASTSAQQIVVGPPSVRLSAPPSA